MANCSTSGKSIHGSRQMGFWCGLAAMSDFPQAFPTLGTTRTFIAFELDASSHERAAALLAHLQAHPEAPAATWVSPESLHITLRFLGPTEDELVPALGKALRAVLRRHSAPSVLLGPLGGFARLGEARVLFQSVQEGTPVLADIFHTFEHEVQRLGFAPEPRAYHPHLTMARLRSPRDLRAWVASLEGPLLAPSSALLEHVTLFRSDTLPSGPVYTPIERVPLG